jgi:hypothetical protein
MYKNYYINRFFNNLKQFNHEDIPIYIICYNNGFMVKDCVISLKNKFKNPIIILDNASDSQKTLNILNELKSNGISVNHQTHNKGYKIINEIENLHKDSYFIITDPDLELKYLPDDTIKKLFEISNHFEKSKKVGLALRIDEIDDIFDLDDNKIINWEKKFWDYKISYNNLELYHADIDTTFHLQNPISKKYNQTDPFQNIRLAGDYAVRHLPWHKSYIQSISKEDFDEYFNEKNNSSSWYQVFKNENWKK